MRDFWQAIKYGARRVRNDASFTIVAAITISLGIGANTTILTAIDALLLHPFSFRNAERLVVLNETLPQFGVKDLVAPGNFYDIKNGNSVFEKIAAAAVWSSHLTEGERPERLYGSQVSEDFFSLLGAAPTLGRTFVPEDFQPGTNFVVVISDGLWNRRFGGKREILGQQLRINDRGYTVVGVMPANFSYPRGGTEVWIPFVPDSESGADRGWRYLQVIALLKSGLTIQEAQSQLDVIAQRLVNAYPEANKDRGLRITTLVEAETTAPRPYLLIAFAAAGFVLLIASVNVANLLLLRGITREKEIAIRVALGARRWLIVQGLLIESVLLALVGGVLGLLWGAGAVELLRVAMPANLAKSIGGWETLRLDWRVFVVVLLLSVVTGVIFGIIPALHSAKSNPGPALKEAGRSSLDARGRNLTRSMFVVIEIALALLLLIGAGLMMRSFIASMNSELGFKSEQVLTFQIDLPFSRYRKEQQTIGFYEQLLASIRTKPGVTAASAVNALPATFNQASEGFVVEGRSTAEHGPEFFAYTPVVMPGYFAAMNIAFLQGRDFSDNDTEQSTAVVIISNKIAQRSFPGESPIGKRLLIGKDPRPREVIGIVADIKHEPFVSRQTEKSEMAIYTPHKQNPWHLMNMVIRTASNDPASVAFLAQSDVSRLDRALAVYNIKTMNEVIADSLAPQRLTSILFSAFGFMALVLAAVGLYAVVSYSVAQRTNEIGIRMALGAQARDILYLVMVQAAKVIVIGVSIGLALAYFGTRLMSKILFGVGTTDALTFVGVPLFLTLTVLIACYIPARRAAKVDPLLALRRE